VAAALARIAEDEARHAELAHAVVAWAMSVASPEQRARIRDGAGTWLQALSRTREEPRDEPRDDGLRRLSEADRRTVHWHAADQIVIPAVSALLSPCHAA